MYQQAQTRWNAQTFRLGRFTAALLLAITAAGLQACDESDPTGTDLTTSTDGGRTGIGAKAVAADASAARGEAALTAAGTLPLPIDDTVSTSGEQEVFRLTQTGTGALGLFRIINSSNGEAALRSESNGGGYSVHGVNTGKGTAGRFDNTSYSSTQPTLWSIQNGLGRAGWFEITNPSNSSQALYTTNAGSGYALNAVARGNGVAGVFENTYYASDRPALHVRTQGTGWTAAFIGTKSGGKGVTILSPSNNVTLDAENTGTGFAAKFIGYGSAKGVYIQTQGGAGLQVVGGSKNAVVHTPSGAKALYTEESTEVWFTDYGFGRLENGRARILLDPAFAQTINPDEPYHVFVQSYGDAELYVRERTPLGFEVAVREGVSNAEFSYRIVAKRLHFEGKRLEPAPWADQLEQR